MSKIEVELRGPIDKEKFDWLEKELKNKGRFIAPKERVVLCYPDPETGSLVEDCKTDIRVRTTNGIPEIIIKQGKWGGSEHRKELSLKGDKGDFDKMVQMMAAMGFNKGVLAVRHGKVFEYKGIEFSIVEVPGHSYYFEAEVMVNDKKNVAKAKEKIKSVIAKLGLSFFTDKEFYGYIHRLNKESNEDFNIKKYKPGYFAKKYGI